MTPEPVVADQATQSYTALVGLLVAGRSQMVLDGARRLADETDDPGLIADASVMTLATLANLGAWHTPAFRAAEEQAHAALERFPIPSAVGHLHAVLAVAADLAGSSRAAFGHLLAAESALAGEPEPSVVTVVAWRHLAVALGAAGLAEEAVTALERCAAAENATSYHPSPAVGASLDAALAWDQRGDTESCVRQLDALLRQARHRLDRHELGNWGLLNAAYAAARLTVLGDDPGVDARRILPVIDSGAADQVRRVALACQALVDRHSAAAADYLSSMPLDTPLGAAEALRLRSIAFEATGRTAEALATEREAFRRWSERMGCLQRVHREQAATLPASAEDMLRAQLAVTTAEALTDPLTGLPNRRHLDRRLAEMFATGSQAAIGLLDLDRFKQVNTVHGHVVGDLVLRRVADILAPAFRAGDFVARYGGDEFVVLLPGTPPAEAHAIGARAVAAIGAADWSGLSGDTGIGASIGWADSAEHATPGDALAAADQRMYAAKAARPAPPSTALP